MKTAVRRIDLAAFLPQAFDEASAHMNSALAGGRAKRVYYGWERYRRLLSHR